MVIQMYVGINNLKNILVKLLIYWLKRKGEILFLQQQKIK
jgi:hypothetical protein